MNQQNNSSLWKNRVLFMSALFGMLFIAIGWAISSQPVEAKPSTLGGYESAMKAQYPNLAANLTGCVACHTGNGQSKGNVNPYGAAYAAAGYSFTAIEAADSDGDSFSNITEINAGTNPGLASDKPVVPPTNTPVPPTATSALPTATNTPVPPTATPTFTPTPTNTPVPRSGVITTTQTTVFTSTDNSFTLIFPSGAVSASTTITHAYRSITDTGSLVLVGSGGEMTAVQNGAPLVNFEKPITIAIRHGNLGSNVASNSRYIYWLSGTTWITEGVTTLERGTDVVTGTTTHFTLFAVLGEAGNKVYLPLVMKNYQPSATNN